jgi:spermidine/putrescine transport system permease protein
MSSTMQVKRGERRPHGIEARRRRTAYGLLSPGAIWLAVFFLVPIAFMAFTSLKSGGILSGGFSFSWNFSNYAEALSGRGEFFMRSFLFAAITTIGTVALSYPAAYWIAFHGGRWKSTLLFMILLPYFVSFVIRTVQWKWILADNGFVLTFLKNLGVVSDDFHVLATWMGVIGGLIYNYLPFAALPLYVAIERIDRTLIEGAYDLYANRTQGFTKVVFPLSMPGVFAATLLTFVPATGDYVEAEILGGPTTKMIGNIIQGEFLVRARYPVAAALSMMLMLLMVVLLGIYAKVLGTEDDTLAAARL